MSAFPPQQIRAMRDTVQQAARPVAALAKRWDELHASAAELAHHAGLAPDNAVTDAATFEDALAKAHQWQREAVWQGIEDIDAMMQPGLTALKTIVARGQDAAAPALALWREFHFAREAVWATVGAREPATAA
ncbi:hypothetical protein [Erythrobacter sp. MTPC3]|uniref:hypothetical protein n=1 Tax=Erythrobacter sp. MTPC3 TaxID=3056564 RepID=UPI0036F2F994